MKEILLFVFALLSGVALGLFYFGGLRFTVRKAVLSKRPTTWIFGSYIIRLGILLIIFRLFAYLGLSRVLLLLIGLIVGRVIITRKSWEKNELGISSAMRADNAFKS